MADMTFPGKEEGGLEFLTWSQLHEEHILQYQHCQSRSEKLRLIETWLELKKHGKRTPLMTELYYNALQWSDKQDLDVAQTSTFFSILSAIHNTCIKTDADNLPEMVSQFQELMALHSVQRPPVAIGLFTHQQAVKINNYMNDTYFRHHKLYKYAFTPQYMLDLRLHYNDEPRPADTDEEEEGTEAGNTAQGQAEDMDESELPEVDGQDAAEAEDRPFMGNAQKELRAIIASMLKVHMKKLKGDVDEQMKHLQSKVEEQLTTLAGKKGK
ncbi:cilia- and flagella-associated protein 119-like isoform X2 [Sycon ciliatum]|uniref:cilia- and flagella-associated protein 119-like isoform X2 n=1 Tax=Sycon ciliatum TaxID=27933 RepID=UPI0020ACAF7C|eukprot:scpid65902/ scgid0735/ Coiled-coil domain-containing protein C16orf93